MTYKVEIIIGSKSDKKAVDASDMIRIFDECGVNWRLSVISAHRNNDELRDFIKGIADFTPEGISAKTQDLDTLPVFIGIAGMAAALPGELAAQTKCFVPVIGVALSGEILDGLDAAFSQTRMPPGVPVSFAGFNAPGLHNAALMAVQILARNNAAIAGKFCDYLVKNRKPPIIGMRTSDMAAEIPLE